MKYFANVQTQLLWFDYDSEGLDVIIKHLSKH